MADPATYQIYALCQGWRECDASHLLYLTDIGRPARLPYFFWILVPDTNDSPILVDTGFLEGDHKKRFAAFEDYRRQRELLAPFGLGHQNPEKIGEPRRAADIGQVEKVGGVALPPALAKRVYLVGRRIGHGGPALQVLGGFICFYLYYAPAPHCGRKPRLVRRVHICVYFTNICFDSSRFFHRPFRNRSVC